MAPTYWGDRCFLPPHGLVLALRFSPPSSPGSANTKEQVPEKDVQNPRVCLCRTKILHVGNVLIDKPQRSVDPNLSEMLTLTMARGYLAALQNAIDSGVDFQHLSLEEVISGSPFCMLGK